MNTTMKIKNENENENISKSESKSESKYNCEWKEIHKNVCLEKSTLSLSAHQLHQNHQNHNAESIPIPIPIPIPVGNMLNDLSTLYQSNPSPSPSPSPSNESSNNTNGCGCIVISPTTSLTSILHKLQFEKEHDQDREHEHAQQREIVRWRNVPLFVLRNLSHPINVNANVKNIKQQQSSESLLNNMFASLSITMGRTGNTNTNTNTNTSTRTTDTRSGMIYAASHIIAISIYMDMSTSTTNMNQELPLSSSLVSNRDVSDNTSNVATTNRSSGAGVFSMSKRMFRKASSAVHSIMASYDLTEQLPNNYGDDYEYDYDVENDENADADEDEDDANLYDLDGNLKVKLKHQGSGRNDINTSTRSGGEDGDAIVEEDEDDAKRPSPRSPNSRISNNEDTMNMNMNMNMNMQTQINSNDVIWNVELFVACWRAIIDHAEHVIRTKKDEGDDHGITFCSADVKVNVNVNVKTDMDMDGGDSVSQGSGVTVAGLILNRYGEDESSFCNFCHRSGQYILDNDKEEIDNDIGIGVGVGVAIGKILQRMTNGTAAMDVLVDTLLTTHQARLSPDRDVLILCPSPNSHSHSHSYSENCDIMKAMTANMLAKEHTNTNTITRMHMHIVHQINEVDMAIFKINNSITALERKMDHHNKQADEAYQKALAIKRQEQEQGQEGKKSSVALLHLKRRNLYQKEAERCSNMLLNLEGGLHTIQRAKDDASVLHAYQLMNASMKALREDNVSGSASGIGIGTIEDVEDVMEDMEMYKSELRDVHDCLSGDMGGNSGGIDDDLEQELLDLMEQDVAHVDGDVDGDDGVDNNPDPIVMPDSKQEGEAGSLMVTEDNQDHTLSDEPGEDDHSEKEATVHPMSA